jgi:hypothetical protein
MFRRETRWSRECAIAQKVKLTQNQRQVPSGQPNSTRPLQKPMKACRTSSTPSTTGILVTACGRICMHRKKINVSTVLAGQKLGIKEADDAIWLVSFMHRDLGYIDLEQRTLQTIDNPSGTRLSPMS